MVHVKNCVKLEIGTHLLTNNISKISKNLTIVFFVICIISQVGILEEYGENTHYEIQLK